MTPMEAINEMNSVKYYGYDDLGNAEQFRDSYGEIFRYNYTEKRWYCWSGKKWCPDRGELVEGLIDNLIKQFEEDAADECDPKRSALAYANLKHVRSNKGKQALEKEARHLMAIHTENFDRRASYFNTPSGMLMAPGKTVWEHEPGYYVTKLSGAKLGDEGVDCPVWKQFLSDIFGADEELIHFVRKALGYSMTGDTSEQCLFFLYGAGRNGKSTFLNVISDIFGDYAVNIQPETILEKRFGSAGAPSPDVARLKGARFVTTVEPNEGERLNEGLIKQLTGGDTITARYLYGKEFEFKPQFKLWIAANNKPVIRGSDLGIWRRIRLIPFSVTIPEDKVDKELPKKLKEEYPAILRWIWEGSLMWKDEGLGSAAKVEQSTQEYRMEMDSVATFLEECTQKSPGGKVKASELYAAYKHWCEECGKSPKNVTKFGMEVVKSFQKVRGNTGWIYKGLELSEA